MSYQEHLDADRRLAILRLLNEMHGAANESVLETALRALGHRAGLTRDAVRADFRWLEERGLVSLEWFQDKVAVATLKRRGHDVATGAITVEGVKRSSFLAD